MNKSYTLQVIKSKHPYYNECMEICVKSKQLYNVGLYQLRQALIHEGKFLSYKDVYVGMKQNENWVSLPRKVSNQVWKQVTTNWSSWFKALKSYKKAYDAFTGRPKMPKYNKSFNTVTYEKCALGTRGLAKGQIRLSKTNLILDISSLKGEIVEAKIIQKKNKFLIKVTYTEEMRNNDLDYKKIAGIDLGVNNLITVATNQADLSHVMVNGRGLKSINQYWNKKVSKLKSKLTKGVKSSKRIRSLTEKRNAKIDDSLHKASSKVVNWLIDNQVGTLIIGKNKQWKNRIKIGKRNNQNFVQIPHARLIDLISYKFEQQNGIVLTNEESYTSKASALDLDTLPKRQLKNKPSFSGRRIKRGLYQTAKGLLFNADVNGALNIIRKVAKNSIDDLVEDAQFIHRCVTPKFI
ncbi:MAG: transposase [Thiomargarita sp.]|nr:transposase [Thiomargarita sp.]